LKRHEQNSNEIKGWRRQMASIQWFPDRSRARSGD
jgi:hypothetical protein